MKDFLKKHGVLLIFVIFFLLVLLEHQFIYMYHDDYGYATLSYAVDINNVGINYPFSLIFTFLYKHYMLWGGRVLGYFYECSLLKMGLFYYRLAQSLVITGIFYFIYKILKSKVNMKDNILALLVVSMYGFLEIMLLRNSVFWISASVHYLWPLLPFFGLVYLLNKDKFNLPLMIICTILTACSHEQVGFMCTSYLVLTIIDDKWFKKRKIAKEKWLLLIISIIGFGFMMLAPGNKVRLASPTSNNFENISLFAKLRYTIPALINGVFEVTSSMFLNLLLVVISYMSIKNLKKYHNKLLYIVCLSNLFITIFSLTKNGFLYFNYFQSFTDNKFLLLLIYLVYGLQIFLMIITVILYYLENHLMVKLFLAGLSSLAVMIVAPYFPSRSNLPFYFICFLVIILTINDMVVNLDKKTVNLIVLAILGISMLNYGTITYGYYKNSAVQKENDKVLKDASQKIKAGEKIESVVYKKLPYILYSGDQPYIEGFDYIEAWIKNYYELPKDIKFIYN